MNLANLKNIESIEAIPNELVLEYLATSIALGIILMLVSIYVGSESVKDSPQAPTSSDNNSQSNAQANSAASQTAILRELVFASSNVLYLCFGMTGIMILVNNNLARAFAIGAAIAVVRFRIKFDSQGLASALLFGVLAGMACGVGQLYTALLLTFAYVILQVVMIQTMKRFGQ